MKKSSDLSDYNDYFDGAVHCASTQSVKMTVINQSALRQTVEQE